MSAKVNPLANPKGSKKVCELCEKPAYIRCTKCNVTFYCGMEHQQHDWVGIHQKVCQLLIPVREPVPHYTLQAERERYCSQLLERQKLLMEVSQMEAEKKLFEKKYNESLPAALLSLRSAKDIYGSSGVQLVPAYLLLAEANIGLGNLPQAEPYLSQADWMVLQTPDCSRTVHHKLHRCLGRLHIAQGSLQEALFHLANDIYYVSEEYGLDSIVTCGGYFLMADVFFKQGNMDIVKSLQTELSILLEKRIDGTITPEDSPDEAQQAEADQMLRSMLEVPEGCPDNLPDRSALLLHSLAMLWILGGDLERAPEFGKRALLFCQAAPDCGLTEPIQRLLQLAEDELHAAESGRSEMPRQSSAHGKHQRSAQ
ncbi:hypothetical protein GJAV_G00188280 [Gymnothorax javanicus]|nr:hypothetical protein GJAV_G00188280 [Gymnothorax javanicus]